jgi:hypothetical protein
MASTSHPVTNTELEVTLTRNTPYSWYVVSKSDKGPEDVKSVSWKFYNPGQGVVSYTPFPAEILSPLLGQNISFNTGKVTLDWNGSDADDDIVSYSIYFGTTASPGLLSDNLTSSILTDVSITANTVYYWKVITKDAKGNTSDSGLYEFKVN